MGFHHILWSGQFLGSLGFVKASINFNNSGPASSLLGLGFKDLALKREVVDGARKGWEGYCNTMSCPLSYNLHPQSCPTHLTLPACVPRSLFRLKQRKERTMLLHFQKFSTSIKSHQLMQNINLLHFSCMERGFNV